jgi:GH24 family phage-related lysozyme (muramidase)/peptidoglycan hydrolase-like protein with peptidoglycan-binding domain
MKLSDAGAQLIAEFEGFRPNLYNDAANNCTIGFGTLVHMGCINGSEPNEFRQGISRERALEMLKQASDRFGRSVDGIGVPLNQNQFDALVSFTYNLGAGWTKKSGLVSALKEGRYGDVPSEMMKWNKAGGRVLPGLTKRRQKESALFSGGGAPSPPSQPVSQGASPPYPGSVMSKEHYQQTHQADPNVALVQQSLAKQGVAVDCDGKFGSGTEAAVKQFQQQKGLPADGKVGPMTWNAIFAGASPAPPYPGTVLSQGRYQQTHQADPNVALIQQALGKLGFPLACDGKFGPVTEAAVKQCQQQKGLPADGKVGPMTWSSFW